jgi:hypothetical protein
MQSPRTSATRDPAVAWEAHEPTAEAPWNPRRVAHLRRRGGFPANWREFQRDFADGPVACVGRRVTRFGITDSESRPRRG